MNSTAEIIQEEAAELTVAEKRFGKILLRGGFTIVPNLIRRYARKIGLTNNERDLWETIISFQRDESFPLGMHSTHSRGNKQIDTDSGTPH